MPGKPYAGTGNGVKPEDDSAVVVIAVPTAIAVPTVIAVAIAGPTVHAVIMGHAKLIAYGLAKGTKGNWAS